MHVCALILRWSSVPAGQLESGQHQASCLQAFKGPAHLTCTKLGGEVNASEPGFDSQLENKSGSAVLIFELFLYSLRAELDRGT